MRVYPNKVQQSTFHGGFLEDRKQVWMKTWRGAMGLRKEIGDRNEASDSDLFPCRDRKARSFNYMLEGLGTSSMCSRNMLEYVENKIQL